MHIGVSGVGLNNTNRKRSAKAPEVVSVSAEYNGNSFLIQFNRYLDDQMPSISAFSITFGEEPVILQGEVAELVDNNETGGVISLTTEDPVTMGTYVITYTKPEEDPIKTLHGNTQVASFEIECEVPDPNLVTEWDETANPFDSFTSDGPLITDAELESNKYAYATTNYFELSIGDTIQINIKLNVLSGATPTLSISDLPYSFSENFVLSDGGDGYYYLDWHEFVVPEGAGGSIRLAIDCSFITNFNITELKVYKV